MKASRFASIAVTAAIALTLVALPTIAFGSVTTDRVSLANDGSQALNASSYCSVSADGRYVAFASLAANLVPGDTNGVWDVFVRDRVLLTTERVSVASDGGQTSGADSLYASISADGRYVAFESNATTLVAGDTNGTWDVFVHDRVTGQTTRASVSSAGVGGDSTSRAPMISGDGRHVIFESWATNLVGDDSNGFVDVFVRDLQDGTTELVSRTTAGAPGDDWSRYSSISADGRYAAFASDAVLVAADTNGESDIYVRDRAASTTERVSLTAAGAQTDGWSGYPSISGDGACVAFQSLAPNLVPGGAGNVSNLFARYRIAGTTSLVSTSMGGAPNARDSYAPSVSFDGRYIAFASDATTLVAGDTNGKTDVFVRDMLAGMTERVSVATGGGQADDNSLYDALYPAISPNGRFIVYDSIATNLVANDTNAVDDVFLADRGVLARTLVRSPLASSKTYKRKHKVARFTLSARLADSRGVGFAGVVVYLQHSKNGKTKWHNHYALVTDAAGVASRAFKTKKQSTSYYRWKTAATGDYPELVTAKQKIRVK
jgi:Tol biopolymer transport system component